MRRQLGSRPQRVTSEAGELPLLQGRAPAALTDGVHRQSVLRHWSTSVGELRYSTKLLSSRKSLRDMIFGSSATRSGVSIKCSQKPKAAPVLTSSLPCNKHQSQYCQTRRSKSTGGGSSRQSFWNSRFSSIQSIIGLSTSGDAMSHWSSGIRSDASRRHRLMMNRPFNATTNVVSRNSRVTPDHCGVLRKLLSIRHTSCHSSNR
jgi:hypothetical protein